jgi:hypothetical protein
MDQYQKVIDGNLRYLNAAICGLFKLLDWPADAGGFNQ